MAYRFTSTMPPARWLVLWFVVNLAPFVLCFDSFLVNSWRYVPKEQGESLMGGVVVLFSLHVVILIIEGTTIALASTFLRVKSRSLTAISRIGSILFYVGLTCYQLFLFLSWYLFTTRSSFITNDEVRLLQFTEDSAWISSVVSPQETLLFALFLAFSTAFSLLLYRGTGVGEGMRKHRRALVGFLTCSMLAGALIASYSWIALSTVERIRVGAIAHGCLSPQLALGYGRLLFPRQTEPHTTLEKKSLHPIESLHDFASRAQNAPLRKKNVIVILVEALRADMLSAFGGNPAILPVINRIAKSGTAVRGYSQATETSEARLSVLSSLYPLKGPERDLRHSWNFPHTFLYELLGQFGYKTALLTESWNADRHISNIKEISLVIDPLHFDFSSIQESLNPWKNEGSRHRGYNAAVADRLKVTLLNQWIKEQHDPFFSLIYFLSSHFPYEQTDAIPQLFSPTEISNEASFLSYPASDSTNMKNRYMNTLRYVDSLIGEIVETLEQKGILKETVIVITGDHGEYFHEHGQVTHSGHLYEEGIAVPIVFSQEIPVPQEIASTGSMGHIDIGPTVLELIGVPAYGNFQGVSLQKRVHVWNERRETLPVFSSSQMFTHEDTIVQWPWKLTINHRGYPDRLVNLEVDRSEISNLTSEYPNITSALQQCLRRYRGEQLSYYSSLALTKEYFPPPHHGRCVFPAG